MTFNRRFWIVANVVLAAVTTGAAHAQAVHMRSHQKISDGEGGFIGSRSSGDLFGMSLASLGDLDGDGVGDLAVGAPFEKDRRRAKRGAVWVLFLNENGTVKAHQKISAGEGGGPPDILDGSGFGLSVASLGDLDGDGVGDLAVGGFAADDEGIGRAAVWVLFLNRDGTVKSYQKISDTEGGFTGILDDHDGFGGGMAALGDLDGDGVGDLAVGASGDDDGGADRGAVWVLFLNKNGTVKLHQKISHTDGGFTGIMDHDDRFGMWMASLGDLDGDGVGDLAVGEWALFLRRNGTVKSNQKISDPEGGFTRNFGGSLASLGDLDGDAVGDVAVWARSDDEAGENGTAAWVLFLDNDGAIKSHQKISETQSGASAIIDHSFSWSLVSVGDLDGNGVRDLVTGGVDVGHGRGAVWVLFLEKTDGDSPVASKDQ